MVLAAVRSLAALGGHEPLLHASCADVAFEMAMNVRVPPAMKLAAPTPSPAYAMGPRPRLPEGGALAGASAGVAGEGEAGAAGAISRVLAFTDATMRSISRFASSASFAAC